MTETREEAVLGRSKEKLKRDIEERVMKAVDEILDIAEVAIVDPQRYKLFRSRVLRYGNNGIRDIKKNLDMHYQILFVPTSEDIIEVQRPTIRRNHFSGTGKGDIR